ncbi:MAG: endolytic transglycosylase MltG [Bacilli bacterium]|nr:endolytic transglycosylase MltG [Bacilli bacterium]
MKIFRNIALALLIALSSIIIFIGVYFNINLSPIDKNNDEFKMVIIPPKTSTKKIGEILEKEGLVRSGQFFYIYCRIYNINDLKASTYELSPNMSLEKIVEILKEGNNYNPDMISITFMEGINMKKIASIIEKNTNNTADDVYNKLKDKDYLDRIIAEYWFLTDKVRNENIYYPLEGYLYPDTYFLENKDVNVEQIFKIMLDEMNKRLTPYQQKIESSNYTVHNYLTIASITELEGVLKEDRANIAGVFYNRLNKNMSLGSDVTTYYAFGIDMNERDLKASEINTYNPYNTRGPKMEGKIPVGPVCMPSIDSIDASINYTGNDYLYFVADKNRKVYFTKTLKEHNAKIKELKDKGVWIEW